MYSTDSVICFMNSLWRRDFLDRVAGLHRTVHARHVL